MSLNISNKSLRSIYTAVGLFIMMAAGIIIYSNTFDSPLVLDDNRCITKDKAVHMTQFSWEAIKTAATKGKIPNRILPNISFAVNYYFGQLNPFGYHLFNLIIHLLTGIFLFLFIKNTLYVYRRDTLDTYPDLIAFFAALIWIVQPVATQSVTYIVQRMASMVALFYILSLLLYVKGRITMLRSPGNRLIPAIFFIGCAISSGCAIVTKENAGTLPLVILLYEWFFFQDLKLKWSRLQILWIAFFVIVFAGLALWFLGENRVLQIMNIYNYRNFSLFERVMTEWRIIIYYISLFLWAPPGRINLDHDYPLSLSPVHPATTMLALAAILGLLAWAAYAAKKDRLIAFCIFWFFITQTIESTIIGLELIFEHRTYLSFMMTSLLFVLTAFLLVKNRRMAYTLLIITALVFSVWTYQRHQTWQAPMTFWADCAAKSPNKQRPNNNLGVALYDTGDISGAVTKYQKAIKIDPNISNAHSNLGNALLKLGKTDEAIQCFHRALSLSPNFIDAINNLGNAFSRQGKTDEAMQCFLRAIDINSNNAEAHNNLGNMLFKQGKTDEAIQYFRHSLALNPDFAEAYNNLGNALSKQRKIDEALQNFYRALALDPDLSEAHNNLGNALMQKGDIRGAISHFQVILNKHPDHVEANINMGAALARLGQIDTAIRHYRTALKSDPNNPEAHNNMGVLLAQKRMLTEALEHFQRALKLRPGYISAINNIRRLEMMLKYKK